MKRGRWSDEDINKGLALYAQGMPYSAIAIELDAQSATTVRKVLKTARDRLGIPLRTHRPNGKSERWLARYEEATLGWPALRGSHEIRDDRFVRTVIREAVSAGLISAAI